MTSLNMSSSQAQIKLDLHMLQSLEKISLQNDIMMLHVSLCKFPLKNRTTRVVLKNERNRVQWTTRNLRVGILYRWVGGGGWPIRLESGCTDSLDF